MPDTLLIPLQLKHLVWYSDRQFCCTPVYSQPGDDLPDNTTLPFNTVEVSNDFIRQDSCLLVRPGLCLSIAPYVFINDLFCQNMQLLVRGIQTCANCFSKRNSDYRPTGQVADSWLFIVNGTVFEGCSPFQSSGYRYHWP